MTRPWEKWWEERANLDFLRRPEQIEHPIRKRIVSEASKIGGSVLDVGCATAIDYPLFKEAGMEYTGVDIIEKFVKRARELYPEADIKHGDAFNLELLDASFDVVYCKDLLEHLPPEGYKRAIGEMWRVAGKLMMIAFFRPPTNDQTVYRVREDGLCSHTYYRGDILSAIKNLVGFGGLRIIEPIDGCSLYVVRKVG